MIKKCLFPAANYGTRFLPGTINFYYLVLKEFICRVTLVLKGILKND